MLYLSDDVPSTPCQQQSPELWFSTRKREKQMAKALCHECYRKLDCLEDALRLEDMMGAQLHGIHGGLDKKERANISVRRIA